MEYTNFPNNTNQEKVQEMAKFTSMEMVCCDI